MMPTMPADDSTNPGTGAPAKKQSSLIIPPDLQKKHPELMELIVGSQSMNDEERQYWINILPVMTVEQIENLRQILKNEKDQLAAIDAKYHKEMDRVDQGRKVEEIEADRREKSKVRSEKEQHGEAEEKDKEEQILRAISDSS